MAFVVNPFKSQRTPSKFETKGPELISYLEYLQNTGNSYVHPYQLKAVLATKKFLQRGTSNADTLPNSPAASPVLIVAPTGAGKSGIIVLLPYALQSQKVLVLTPSKVISEQLGVAFGLNNDSSKSFFEETGICVDKTKLGNVLDPPKIISVPGAFRKERHGDLVIVSAQKFGGRSKDTLNLLYGKDVVIEDVKKAFHEFDTLIVDEAHHYPAATLKRIVEEFQVEVAGMEKKIIFLTATHTKRNAQGVDEPILPVQRIAYMITPQDCQGTTTRMCEFEEKLDVATLGDDILNWLNLHAYLEPRLKYPQAMVFVRTTPETIKYAEVINEATGHPNFAVALWAKKETYDEDLKNFNEGRYRVVVTCGLLLEGYDNSRVTLCVILRNVRSRILFAQFIGRCMRKHRFLEGGPPDSTVARVLSYIQYGQKTLWEEREQLARDGEDPVAEDEDENALF